MRVVTKPLQHVLLLLLYRATALPVLPANSGQLCRVRVLLLPLLTPALQLQVSLLVVQLPCVGLSIQELLLQVVVLILTM